MRRLLSAAVLVAASALTLVGCPEQNVDNVKFPDAWWVPGEDAGLPDAAFVPTDSAVWVAAPPPADHQTFKLNAVAAKGTSVVAVGADGLMFVHDSSTSPLWTYQSAGAAVALNAVTAVSTTQWWAAGAAKTVVRYDGTTPTVETLPGAATPDLKAIAASGTEVWAAGAAGARYRYDVGTSAWSDETPPTGGMPPDITGLWYSGLKFYEVDAGGNVRGLTPTGWQGVTNLNNARLLAVWGFSDDDYWIVGDKVVWHYTTQFSFRNETPADVGTWNAVFGLGPTDVWIGSKERGLLKWNGGGWDRAAGFSLTGKDLFGIGGSFEAGLWSVGDNVLQQLAK